MARSTMILPEHFLEEIVARMPYSPSIFRFRCLSKGWLARLSSAESQDDDGDKQFASSFQDLQVLRRPFNDWDPSSFLILFTRHNICCAYSSYTNSVDVLPPLSFMSAKDLPSLSIMHADGPLVVFLLTPPKKTIQEIHEELFEELSEQVGWQDVDKRITEEDTCVLYITNICTGSWKKLPPLPNVRDTLRFKSLKLVCDTTSGTYKVICMVGGKTRGSFPIQIYDSKTETWRRKELAPYRPYLWNNKLEYLNGVVYTLAPYEHPLHTALQLCLLAFNLEEWKIVRLPLQYTDEIESALHSVTGTVSIVTCNARLLFILTDGGYFGTDEILTVLEIDLVSLRVRKLSRSSASSIIGIKGSLRSLTGMNPISGLRIRASGDQIFLGNPDHRMVAYNIVTDEWSLTSSAGKRSLDGERFSLRGARALRDEGSLRSSSGERHPFYLGETSLGDERYFSGERLRLRCDGCFRPGLNLFMAV